MTILILLSNYGNFLSSFRTILQQSESEESAGLILLKSLASFLLMFVGSALIGIIFALTSALVRMHVLYKGVSCPQNVH